MPPETPSNTLPNPKQAPAGKPLIIPVFLPHSGCPHRCVFCNQNLISERRSAFPSQGDIAGSVRWYLDQSRPGRYPVEVAFFGGNFLGLSPEYRAHCIQAVLPFLQNGRVHVLRCSTRPDTITPLTVKYLSSYPFATIEIGIQSMDDQVLRRSARGHTVQDSVRAIRLLRESGYRVGAQIMVGLPGSDAEKDRKTAELTAASGPDFARIYPTLVLRKSSLARLYAAGRYFPLALTEAVERSRVMLGIFLDHDIPVIRIGLQSTDTLMNPDEVLAGPFHPAFGHLVYAARFRAMAQQELDAREKGSDRVQVRVHPLDQSRFRGNRNENIRYLQQRYGFSQIDVIPDVSVFRNQIRIEPRTG